MVFQRPTTSNIAILPKSGYQQIPLVGVRCVSSIENGTINNVKHYNKLSREGNSINNKDLEVIQTYISKDEYLFEFTGCIEFIYNAYQFVIIDIPKDQETGIEKETYIKRLNFMYENIRNDYIINRKTVMGIDTESISTPSLFRPLDYAYAYGNDILFDLSNKENMFIIVGSATEQKEKLLIPKKDYDSLNKVPKVIKKTFTNETNVLESVNIWKSSLFADKTMPRIEKNEEEYIEFENPHEYYLIAGKVDNELKIFGKVAKNVKILNNLLIPNQNESLTYSWLNPNLESNYSSIVYFDTAYVVGCTTPKINTKHMSTVTILNILSTISNFSDIENIDCISIIDNNKKKFAAFPTKQLAQELASRLSPYKQFKNVVESLSQFSNDVIVTNKRSSTDMLSSDDDEDATVTKKNKN